MKPDRATYCKCGGMVLFFDEHLTIMHEDPVCAEFLERARTTGMKRESVHAVNVETMETVEVSPEDP